MHKSAISHRTARVERPRRTHLSATHAVRAARASDVDEIVALTEPFVAEGALLPRSQAEVGAAIADYVVVVDGHDRVLACGTLTEYSPSLAEVGSVAVASSAQGLGLGTMVVRGLEALARRRRTQELFAVSTAGRFFESLGYRSTAVSRYPEKLARYEKLASQGVEIRPKSCFRKRVA